MIYDYIFCGFGLSAMLVLDRFADDGLLSGKTVLIVGNDSRQDRTWSFWENGAGRYDGLLTKRWANAVFKSNFRTGILERGNSYKMLEPHRLGKAVSDRLKEFPGIEFRTENVESVIDNGESVKVRTNIGTYIGKKVFNSIPKEIFPSRKHPLLLQHFIGWMVETPDNHFNPDEATFMDFSIPQSGNTRFIYVLPMSKTKALVEYTLFSPATLDESEYESGIRHYLETIGIKEYTIEKKESGVIPMTAYPFWKNNTKNVLNIGTAGGWTKPSTGYTLIYAMKRSAQLSDFTSNPDADFTKFHRTSRFTWYDRIFVSILYNENAKGKYIFSTLFRRADPGTILRFLREESTIREDLIVLASCPKRLFIWHVLRHFRRFI